MSNHRLIKDFIHQKLVINPYYFALLLFGLLRINFSYVFSFDKGIDLSSFFFLLYAVSQSLLEILIGVFIANLIRTYLHKSFYYTFISLCLLGVFIHYVDFLLVRFMDFSIFFGINIILDETLENFIELLHLTGIGIDWWLFGSIAATILIPLTAITLYSLTSKLTHLRPLKISQAHLLKTLCYIPIGLILFDLTFSPLINEEQFRFCQRMLPWKSTFLKPKEQILDLTHAYKADPSEEQALKQLHLHPIHLEKKPNIYLFITESLREDFVTSQTAPNVVAFREENIQLTQTFSNANCTQLSWYSIFHSQYPLTWANKKKNWKSGSISLQALKKLGYKIHVYSAAQLKYYDVGELIFGKKNHLADSYNLYPHYAPVTAAETDEKAINQLIHDHENQWAREGNLFLIFLDATHFNYSWPKNYPIQFTPISEEKTNLRVSNSIRDIELIKNRYRNSIHYMDSLFGKMITCLKDKKLYEESLIVFTGDHGEEFFEEGQLFHASHLSRMQTNAPIYYKLGDNHRTKNWSGKKILSSHVDIFPTILDTLIGEKNFFSLFDGESIFKENRFPFVISSRHNGGRNPTEFFIHDGEKKMIARFPSSKNCLNKIEILSLKDMRDKTIHIGNATEMESYIHAQYGGALRELFFDSRKPVPTSRSPVPIHKSR